MTEGDGIRRNVAHVDSTERKRLRDAIIELHKDKKHHYPGDRNDDIPGGVSKWFKQDEIHQATHVHRGPAFLTWHRELCNRFEDLLRENCIIQKPINSAFSINLMLNIGTTFS
jgi:hypothetical protein